MGLQSHLKDNSVKTNQANTRRGTNAVLIMGHPLRQWPGISAISAEHRFSQVIGGWTGQNIIPGIQEKDYPDDVATSHTAC